MTAAPFPDPDEHDALDPQLAAVAAAILDGQPVDWSALGDGSSARSFSGELQIVADVAAVHRSAADLPADPLHFPPSYPWTVGTLMITAPLGAGTFGEVFRAWDTQLHRDVAVKLLFPRRDDRDPDRALSEGRLLARVRHPNVVAVYTAERIERRVGLVTEYVNGRTLADIVRESGPLPARDVLQIGVDLCRALGAVHAAGLLHRDIKPQNVMRDAAGRIVLMDFGAGEQADAAHSVAGTPLYLAPEILEGAPATVQSDIYSLGVLLHYLLTGAHPVGGRSVTEIREAHRSGQPTPLRAARSDIPRAVAAPIDRASDPVPSRRFASATELGHALASATVSRLPRRSHGMVALALAAFVAVASWTAWRAPRAPSNALQFHEREWALIAEFENATGEPQFSRSLQHALAHELSNSTYVNVVSRARIDDALLLMAKPAGIPIDAATGREVALRDGGIRALVTGHVEKLGGAYVLTAQIVDPSSGTVQGSRRAEAKTVDAVPGAIRDLASWVRKELGESPRQVENSVRQLEKVRTPSLEASRLYSEAFEAGTRGRWQESAELVRASLTRDPDFASAHIWLAHALRNLRRPADEYLAHARRAFELADGAPDRERHFILGSYYGMTGDDERALASYAALLRLHPDHFWALNNAEQVSERLGRPREEVAALVVRAATARPNDFILQTRAAQSLLTTSGLEPAKPYVERARALAGSAPPGAASGQNTVWLQLLPVHELWLQRRYAEASALLANAGSGPAIEQAGDVGFWLRGSLHLTLGQIARAEQSFGRVANPALRPVMLGSVALARGDRALVIRSLRGYTGYDLAAASLLVSVGDVEGGRALLRRIPEVPGHSAWTQAQVEVAAENHAARPTLEEGVRRLRALTGVRAYLYSETLAASLAATGDVAAAVKVLQDTCALRERLYARAAHNGYYVLRLQAQLAALYRQSGRLDEARTIEQEVRDALVTADADHALKRQLQNGRQ